MNFVYKQLSIYVSLILLLFIQISFAQSPGSLFVNAGADQTITCGSNGCVDLTATFQETFETDGAQYTVSSILYEPPFAFNGLANQLNPEVDDAWSNVDELPFDFCFFGDLVDEFQVGSNGVLRFDVDPYDVGAGTNAWSFSSNLPNNFEDALGEANVLLPVHDIDPSVSSNEEIGYEVLGTYPNRVLVVSYYQVPYYSCTNLRATHMAVFYEFSNIIDFYIKDKPICSSWNGGRAALGIQNDAGTIAYVPPGRNTSNSPWQTTNEAWRFSPIGEETYVFTWLDEDGNVISTDPTINVCEPGTYTAKVVYTNTCNDETYTLTDEVIVTSSQPFQINLGDNIETCEIEEIELDASVGAPAGALFEWFYNNVSQGPPTAGNSTYLVVSPNSGTYKVEVTDPLDPTCVVTDEIEIDFADTFIPDFTIEETYCVDSGMITLPTVSNNGYNGTWLPTQIDTSTVGTSQYEFTPFDGQCAEPIILEVTVIPKELPVFPTIPPICIDGEAPILNPNSDNGISGTWIPAIIETDEEGEFEYHFYPDAEFCAEEVVITVIITNSLSPEFNYDNSYCQNEINVEDLLDQDLNGITGTWIPNIIDTGILGDTDYTFYPDAGQCAEEYILTVTIYPQPILNSVEEQEICDDDFDGIFVTDLTDLNPLVGGGAGLVYSYYSTLGDISSEDPIPSSQWNNYAFDSLPATIYVVGESTEGCRSVEIPVQFIGQDEVAHNAGPFGPIEFCSENSVDLTQFEGAIGAIGAEYQYYNTLLDARNGTNEIINTTEFNPEMNQTSVFVRLDSEDFCSAFVEILLERLPTPSLTVSHSAEILCPDESFEASATSDDPNATFEWTMEDGTILTGPIQNINQIGTYTIVAYSEDGCISETRTLSVTLPTSPVITNLEMGNNYVIVGAENGGNGPLEYSLDGVLWQNSPQLSNLIPGESYTIWVRSGGCMVEKYTFTILSIPNLLSPNNDGKNDVWEIRGIDATPGATIKIFDRFGKIFVDTNFEGNYLWNGKYLGNNVPSGDYWYMILVPSDGIIIERKFVGHITVRNH